MTAAKSQSPPQAACCEWRSRSGAEDTSTGAVERPSLRLCPSAQMQTLSRVGEARRAAAILPRTDAFVWGKKKRKKKRVKCATLSDFHAAPWRDQREERRLAGLIGASRALARKWRVSVFRLSSSSRSELSVPVRRVYCGFQRAGAGHLIGSRQCQSKRGKIPQNAFSFFFFFLEDDRIVWKQFLKFLQTLFFF